MCDCHSPTFCTGTRPSIVMINPRTGCHVAIDACIAHVITYLWAHDIHTAGCCCGHNRRIPWVGLWDKPDPATATKVRQLIAKLDDRDWEIT